MTNLDRWRDYAEPFGCFGPLVTPEQALSLDATAGMAHYDSRSVVALTTFARYVTTFLTSPHNRLGRKGAVCPYTGGALARGFIRMSACPLASVRSDVLVDAMQEMRAVFADLSGPEVNTRGDSMYKAIIVLLPMLPASRVAEMVDAVQKKLKPGYIREGFMIGEFYPGCPAPGLHNPAFRPLQTPVASLAIREITPFDAPFMIDDDLYVAGYLERFGWAGHERLIALLQKPGNCILPERSASAMKLLKGWAAVNSGKDVDVRSVR